MTSWEQYKQTMLLEEEVFECARLGDIPGLRTYLARGGDANIKNHKGHCLLMLAAYNDQEEACRVLLQAGADVNARDRGGNTILMGVAFKGYPHLASLLIESGADTSMRNYLGMTAMIFAKTFGREDVVRLLSAAPS